MYLTAGQNQQITPKCTRRLATTNRSRVSIRSQSSKFFLTPSLINTQNLVISCNVCTDGPKNLGDAGASFGWGRGSLFNDTFSTNRLYRAIEVQCISRRAGEQHNHTIEQWNDRINLKKSYALFSLGFMETVPSPRLGFLRGVFLANHLASTET